MPGLTATLDSVLRLLVLASATAAGLVTLTHWAVRERRLAPFGPWPNFVRRIADPLLHPLEGWLRRLGRNPQEASFWLFGLTLAGGIVLLSVSRWVVGLVFTLEALRSATPRVWARVVIDLLFEMLMLALMVRVLGSWFGWSRHTRWTRPAWLATDWLVEPIRRRLPPLGMLDLSPIVAWIALLVLRGLVVSLI